MNVAARQSGHSAAQAYLAARSTPSQAIPISQQLNLLTTTSCGSQQRNPTPLTPPNSFNDSLNYFGGRLTPGRRDSNPHHHNAHHHHHHHQRNHNHLTTSLDIKSRLPTKSKDPIPGCHGSIRNACAVGGPGDGGIDQSNVGRLLMGREPARRRSYQFSESHLEKEGLQSPRGQSGRIRIGSLTPVPASWDPAAALLRKYSWSGRHSASLSPTEIQSGLNTLEVEAISACQELSFSLKEIHISELLPRTPELVFINVTTVEGIAYCIELTQRGWRVCSLRHDSMNGDLDSLQLHIEYFENPYAVLDKISPGYRREFGEALANRLALEMEANRKRTENESEENGSEENGNGENGNEEPDSLIMAMDNSD